MGRFSPPQVYTHAGAYYSSRSFRNKKKIYTALKAYIDKIVFRTGPDRVHANPGVTNMR